jgi:hypothetical protein
VLEPVAPGPPPHLRIGHVVLQRGPLLGLGVAGPHAVRTAEVGDAAVGADAGAGQHHDVLALVDPGAHPVDLALDLAEIVVGIVELVGTLGIVAHP